jgi:hypothetical protein
MTTITATEAKDLLVKSWNEFNEDEAPRLGAALAYYTILSLAPLLILLIALAGLVFGKEAATGQLVSQIQGMVGKEGAEAIQQMIAGASKPASGIVASIPHVAFRRKFGCGGIEGSVEHHLGQASGLRSRCRWNGDAALEGIRSGARRRIPFAGISDSQFPGCRCGRILHRHSPDTRVRYACGAVRRFAVGHCRRLRGTVQVLA